jgi:hypothetical protein
MDFQPPERVPAFPLAAAIVIGTLPVGMLWGFIFAFLSFPLGLSPIARMTSLITAYAAASALLIGVPLGLLLLRDPRASWRRWLGTALAAGVIALGVIAVWTVQGNVRFLLDGILFKALAVATVAVLAYAALSAVAARLLLRRFIRLRAQAG